METISYDDAAYPVRAGIIDAQQKRWDALSKPGTWLTGEERVAVMAEVRHARDCALCAEQAAALSPYTVTGDHDTIGELPGNWIEVIHRIVGDPGRLTHDWYQRMLDSGIEDTAYVELVSAIAHTTAIDTFARGVGVPQHPLPEPQPGEPVRYRPPAARQQDYWVPHICRGEEDPSESDFGDELMAANIRRALTLVPDELRGFWDLINEQYLSTPQMLNMMPLNRAISRVQIELLASRVSALNQCTY